MILYAGLHEPRVRRRRSPLSSRLEATLRTGRALFELLTAAPALHQRLKEAGYGGSLRISMMRGTRPAGGLETRRGIIVDLGRRHMDRLADETVRWSCIGL